MKDQIPAKYVTAAGNHQKIVIELPTRLDFDTVANLWKESIALLKQYQPSALTLLAHNVNYCDGSGIALLSELQAMQTSHSNSCEIKDLKKCFHQLLTATQVIGRQEKATKKMKRAPLPTYIGKKLVENKKKIFRCITFVGEFFYQLGRACKTPKNIRWQDTINFIETIGPNALPITGLLGFLFGLILAFQSVIPLRSFGAEIYVIRLVGISLVRELAPLLTGIIIIARTASAFAAEIGTMKINQEVDALNTMGIESMRFLVLPRVLAVILIMPALTVFLALFSFLGAYLVSLSLGFGFHIFMNELYQSFTYTPIVTSMIKAIVFGLLIAITGCYHGLNTGHGSTAVGRATTSAVVAGIVVLTLADGIFSILIYILWI